jgi:DNA repair exonuclease SbcCD nuclease subunit
MSEKVIVTSDIHIHTYKQFNEDGRRLKNGIAYLDYLFKLAHANKIKYILMSGDLTNNMQIIATKVINAIMACLWRNFTQMKYDVKIIAISGNHDFADKNLYDTPGESALQAFAEVFPHDFILIDNNWFDTEGGNRIQGIPYYDHAEHFKQALSKSKKRDQNSFLLMHQSVASGLPIDDDIMCTDTLFDPFTMVFNGHIHENKQVADFFINVGSPMHRDANDAGKEKGFWIVDLDEPLETITFMETTKKFPQFIHKFMGEELNEWEKQQYVMWVQNPAMAQTKDHQIAEKFNTSLKPKELMANFCKEVLPKEEYKAKLEFGLTLL